MDTSNLLENNFEFNNEHHVFENLFSVVYIQDDPISVPYKKNNSKLFVGKTLKKMIA